MNPLKEIFDAITAEGFSARVVALIDNYIDDILYGKTSFPRFNLSEHAGFCSAGAPLIGASIVACYARASLEASSNVTSGEGSRPSNWEIDELQEQLIEQWAREANLWESFTRDSDHIFRIVLTQPYISCKRLASKDEIDELAFSKGFRDNRNGEGVNYISERIALEDMHPANVFIDDVTYKPICIDCIVKFVNNYQLSTFN